MKNMVTPSFLAVGMWLARGAITLGLFLASARVDANAATPILVELFTSEGCSSCPPADALLRTLDTNQPVPGSQLIVLEEHVDYWDDLGWKDPFSSHPLTERQTTYAKRLHLDGPYTPQMVVDGIDEFVGSDRARANRAFDKARPAPKVMVRISALNLQNGKLTAHVDAGTVSEAAEVFVALALEHAESSVLHGENRGHHLQHVAVVKSLSKVGTVGKGETFSSDVSLSTGPAGESYRVIAFIQEANQGKVVGAAVERK